MNEGALVKSLVVIALCLAGVAGVPPRTKSKTVPTTRPSAKDEELARRLLGDDRAGRDSPRKLLALMNDAGERLTQKYDSGEETQGVQAKALKAIDDAIAEARQQMSQPRSSSSRQKGESRKAGQRDASRQQSKSTSAKPGAAA